MKLFNNSSLTCSQSIVPSGLQLFFVPYILHLHVVAEAIAQETGGQACTKPVFAVRQAQKEPRQYTQAFTLGISRNY